MGQAVMTSEQMVDTNNLGTITGSGDNRCVTLKRAFDYSINDVWDALVNPDAVGKWFAPWTIDPQVDGRIKLDFGSVAVTGDIKAFTPPSRFSYTWEQAGEKTSLVQYELTELQANKTLVTITQTELEHAVTCDVAAGWHNMLDHLSQFIATGVAAVQDEAYWKKLYATYQAMME